AMTVWAKPWEGAFGRLAGAGVLVVASLAGCNRKAPAPDPADAPPARGGEAPAAKKPPPDPRLHQSFADATRPDPPAEAQRPDDMPMTGTPTGKLCTEVQRLWATIRFVSDSGKPLAYAATLETSHGTVEIALRPDLAPNHVRSFVALAKAGYYDGLLFERVVHQQAPDDPETFLDSIEGGCPGGTGERGYGSVGYWLKPELNPQVAHEPGTVGACHGEELDSAGCRFYVVYQCKTKALDGNYTVFGKVSKGLDVVRKIYEQPVKIEEGDPDGCHRPEQPVIIRKVTVQSKEVDN